MTAEPIGRRERKKAATRQALADAALRLFLERGYDRVGVKEIADAADVSVTTLFKHFPSKEALVFDQDAEHEAALVSAVRDRPAGTSVLAALRGHLLAVRTADKRGDPVFAAFLQLVQDTPALRDYTRQMWLRHEVALAAVLAEEHGVPPTDPACAALAHFALETVALVQTRDDPRDTMNRAFDILERGWPAARG
jgi:AcrR family transcriptional regulator